jgi:hypothetical protein
VPHGATLAAKFLNHFKRPRLSWFASSCKGDLAVSKKCPHQVRNEANRYELIRSRQTKKFHVAQAFL